MNNLVKLIQIDANWIRIASDIGKKEIWKILSFSKFIRVPYRPKPQYTEMSLLKKKGWLFPRGLLTYVINNLNKQGLNIEYDEINIEKIETFQPELPDITFEKYQWEVLEEVNKKDHGIIVVPTAGGKTIIAGGIMSLYGFPPTIFCTINKTIFNQTYEDFIKWFPDIPIGKIGDGVKDYQHITVCLYQSLKPFLQETKINPILLLFDEAHAATEAIRTIVEKLPTAFYRYGLTATVQEEKQNKEKFLLMTGNIGSVISEISDESCDSRIINDVKVYMVNNLNKNPEGTTYQQIYRKDILFNKQRNINMVKAAKKYILDKGLSCLYSVTEVKHMKEIQRIAKKQGIRATIAHGTMKGDAEEIKRLLNEKKEKFVIATIFKVGSNIPNLEGVVLGATRKSNIEINQIIGRGRRKVKGKDSLVVIDSFDTIKANKEHLKFFDKEERTKLKNHYRKFKNYSEERQEIYNKKGWKIKRVFIS